MVQIAGLCQLSDGFIKPPDEDGGASTVKLFQSHGVESVAPYLRLLDDNSVF
jgi:hypothetical protein